MTLPEYTLPHRRVYPRWLRPAFGMASFLFGVALANLLILTFADPTRSHPAALTIVTGFAAIFFALASLHYYLARGVNKRQRLQLGVWISKRYDLHLSDRQLARLAKPSTARNIPFPGWVSNPIIHFQQDAAGIRHMIHLLLIEVDDQYIIFSPEASGEYPLNPQVVVKENTDFMEEAWKEIDEHGGIYILTPEQEYFNGEIVRARVPNGPDVALFWSDRLRADLWLNEDTANKDQAWQVSYLSLPDIFNQVLPAMIRENQSIGLNWGDGARAYDAAWFTAKLTQRFNWLAS